MRSLQDLSPGGRPFVLLDPYTARHSGGLALGAFWLRPSPSEHLEAGYSLAVSEGVTTVTRAFTAGARWGHEVRFVPEETLSLSLSRFAWEAGPKFGPIEPMVHVGATLFSFDFAESSVSFGMFSPRVGAGLWMDLGKTRVGVNAFAEYSWRWTGQPSTFARGITIELQPQLPPLQKAKRKRAR